MSETLKEFEIREGNGNDGAYLRGTVEAVDAFEALKKASRMGMINQPWDVKITKDIEGDSVQAHIASYVNNGPLGVRWLAEANDIEEMNKRITSAN